MKKLLIIFAAVVAIAIGAAAFMFIVNKVKGEVFTLTDKYNSLEVTLNYPKEKGFTVDGFDENYTTDYPKKTLRNAKNNYIASFTFKKDLEDIYNQEMEHAKENKYFSEVEYNKYVGYKYKETSSDTIEMILKLKKEKTKKYVLLCLKLSKIDIGNKDTNLNKIFNSKEFQKILKTITFTDQVEDIRVVDGVISSNHKLVVKELTAPNSDYIVNQYNDDIGIMNSYIINNNKSKCNNCGAYFRLYYYGDKKKYKNIKTFQDYREKTTNPPVTYTDGNLFGNKTKKEDSNIDLSDYTRYETGLIENDGKVYEYLYYIYKGVDNSIGEKLVNDVFDNIEIKY